MSSSDSMTLLAAAVGDPAGTRTITSIIALLLVLGIALLMLAIWLFKLTRPDAELLAPLELMGERKWRRADPVWQRRRLDAVRPPDAQPLEPSAAPPVLDEAFLRGPLATGFDDLHDDAHVDHRDEAGDDAGDDAGDGSVPGAEPGDGVADADQPDRNGDGDVDVDATSDESVASAMQQPASATPIGIERPTPDDLPDRELDPEIMAAALAELDAELGRAVRRDEQSPE